MLALTFFIGLTGLAPADMAELIAERLCALDKLVLEVTLETYGVSGDTPMLDSSVWGAPTESYPYVLTILRPHLRAELLKDDAAAGYEPTITSVSQDVQIAQHVRANLQDGRTRYTVSWNTFNSGVLNALLQVFELRLTGTAADFDLVALLRHPSARLVRCVGECSTYTAHLPPEPGAPWNRYFEIDVNQRGTPLRLRTVLDFEDPKVACLTHEQFTLQTTELNGAELPVETVITSRWSMTPHYWAVQRIKVQRAEIQERLTLTDVRIDARKQNAHVVEYFPDGSSVSTTYDETGQIVSQSRHDPAYTLATRTRWHRAVPPLALTVGLVTAALLIRLSKTTLR